MTDPGKEEKMASPQTEEGYTKIANEILEALAKVNLNAYQWRVLIAVFRKTYGYRKREDRISVSQLCEITGLKHGHVSRALAELQARGFITRTQRGTRQSGYLISFQKDWENWKLVPNQVYRKTRTQPGPTRTQRGTKLVPNQGNTKEKKETNKRKGSPPHEIPDDFELTQKLVDMARNQGMPGGMIRVEFDSFKANHQAKGSKFKRWDRAWLTWVLNWKKWKMKKWRE